MLWLGLLASMTLAPANGPIYLTCEWRVDSETSRVNVSLDEANQRAVIAIVDGRTVTRSALFTPTEVRVVDEPMTWTFSRVDLTFRRTFSFMPPSDPGNVGKCKLAPAPAKRAF